MSAPLSRGNVDQIAAAQAIRDAGAYICWDAFNRFYGPRATCLAMEAAVAALLRGGDGVAVELAIERALVALDQGRSRHLLALVAA